MLRLMVRGSSSNINNDLVCDVMLKYFNEHTVGILIFAGKKGVDTYIGHLSQNYNYQIRVYFAKWQLFGASADFIRDKRMIDEEGPDILIAFPTKYSFGIYRTIRYARKKGIRVVVHPLN